MIGTLRDLLIKCYYVRLNPTSTTVPCYVFPNPPSLSMRMLKATSWFQLLAISPYDVFAALEIAVSRLSFWSMGRVPYFKTTFKRLYFPNSKSWVTEFRNKEKCTKSIAYRHFFDAVSNSCYLQTDHSNRPPCCLFSEIRSRIGAEMYDVTSFWDMEMSANLWVHS